MIDDTEVTGLWVCEICAEEIKEEQPQISFTANSTMIEGDQYHELGDAREIVFTIFHAKCVVDTMEMDHCDDIDYIWEAREMLQHSLLCDDCQALVPPPESTPPEPVKKTRPSHLTVLKGGQD